MEKLTHYFAWKSPVTSSGPAFTRWPELHRKRFLVLARGKLNTALVEFEGGRREVISRNVMRRIN